MVPIECLGRRMVSSGRFGARNRRICCLVFNRPTPGTHRRLIFYEPYKVIVLRPDPERVRRGDSRAYLIVENGEFLVEFWCKGPREGSRCLVLYSRQKINVAPPSVGGAGRAYAERGG